MMQNWPDLLSLAGQLFAAAVMGALVGLERERTEHPAGLRTNILVCVGSALFTLVSREMAGTQHDPGRIAAQVVTGIGFLGAGTILRQGAVVRGLTTAASLWVVAGIGMAVAAGGAMAWLAAFATLLVVFTLNVLNRLELVRASHSGDHSLSIAMTADGEALGRLLSGLTEQRVELRRVALDSEERGALFQLRLQLRTPTEVTPASLAQWLSSQPAVAHFEWE
jgi:putative Mg2+ transporter-C (MgtC) family protein